jgi:oligopeptide/dipeptide ABC transporter ATP-binding protein
MYAGRIVEEGTTAEVFANPLHPYTRGLLASLPRIDTPPRGTLDAIPGLPPDLGHLPPGCPFHPRCNLATDRCRRDRPPVAVVSPLTLPTPLISVAVAIAVYHTPITGQMLVGGALTFVGVAIITLRTAQRRDTDVPVEPI